MSLNLSLWVGFSILKGKGGDKSPKSKKKVEQEKQNKEKLIFSCTAQKGKETPEIVSSPSVVSCVHAFL